MKARFLILFLLASFWGNTQNYNLDEIDYQNVNLAIDCNEISYQNFLESFPLIFVDSVSIGQLIHHCMIPFENSAYNCIAGLDIFMEETKQLFDLNNDRDGSENELLKAFINSNEIYKLGRIYSSSVNRLESFLVVIFNKDQNLEEIIRIYALNYSSGKLKSIIKVAEKVSSDFGTIDLQTLIDKDRSQGITLKLIKRNMTDNHFEKFHETSIEKATINNQGFVIINESIQR